MKALKFFLCILLIVLSSAFVYSAEMDYNYQKEILIPRFRMIQTNYNDFIPEEFDLMSPFDSKVPLYEGKALPKDHPEMRTTYLFSTYFISEPEKNPPDISLFIGPMGYPYDIYINGHRIFEGGSKNDPYTSTIYRSYSVFVDQLILRPTNETNHLLVIAYPQYEIMQLGDIRLTTREKAEKMRYLRNLFNVNLITGFIVAAAMIGIYMLLMRWVGKDKSVQILMIVGFSFSFIISYWTITNHHSYNSEIFNEIMGRNGMLLGMSFLSLFFIAEYQTIKRMRTLAAIIISVILIPIFLMILLPTKQNIRLIFGISFAFYIIPLFLVALVLVYIQAFKYRIFSYFFAINIIAVSAFYDGYMLLNNRMPFCWITPYAYMALSICMFYLTAIRIGTINDQLKMKTKELNELSERREQIIQTKTRELEIETRDKLRTQEEFYRSRQQLLRSFEYAPIGIIILNPELEITYNNRYIDQLSGDKFERMAGRRLIDLLDSDSAEVVNKELDSLVHGEKDRIDIGLGKIEQTRFFDIDVNITLSRVNFESDQFIIFCFIREISSEDIKARRQNQIIQKIRQLTTQFEDVNSLIRRQEFAENVVNLSDYEITSREKEIIRSVMDGLSNQEIAERLFLSVNTVKTYLNSVYKKMDVKNRNELHALLKDTVVI